MYDKNVLENDNFTLKQYGILKNSVLTLELISPFKNIGNIFIVNHFK